MSEHKPKFELIWGHMHELRLKIEPNSKSATLKSISFPVVFSYFSGSGRFQKRSQLQDGLDLTGLLFLNLMQRYKSVILLFAASLCIRTL